jgi:hypothetical protein
LKTAFRSTALAIILLAFAGIPDAHADCPLQSDYAAPHTRTDFVKGGLVYDLTNNVLKTCDGTSWNTVAAGGVGAGGNTMVSGWPDSISCSGSSGSLIFDFMWSDSTSNYYYQTRGDYASAGSIPSMRYNSSGTQNLHTADGGWGNYMTSCSGKTIAQLYTAGQAYNFIGNSSAAAAGTTNEIQFREGGNLQADTTLVYDNVNNRVGIGTTTPRSALHVKQASAASQYALFQGGGGGGGTLFDVSDTIPIVSSYGMIGYNGAALIPDRWGNASTVDAHNVLYLGGSQRNSNGVSSTLAFGNWGYFTSTGTGAGGLGNATAQGDAVKFDIRLEEAGSEFAQRLNFRSRSATNTNQNVLSLLSSGNVGIGIASPGQKLSVAGTIESTSGGFRFPDGTTQTTSASGLNCTNVTAAFSASAASTATCGAGYTMTGGGFQCACGNGCMAAANYPNGNGWTAGYCFYYSGTAYGGTTYARCCQ